ncbi:hypothetical protein [uncultured Nostoc sp.]|uniref:hypothetical protein n=1 Tax=uncultured Nostoc sp. TaxID=340711 RepID=UPI0035C952EF
MKFPILFKTLPLVSFFLLTPFSIIATFPLIGSTLHTTTKTEQLKWLKLTLSGHTAPVRALTLSPMVKFLLVVAMIRCWIRKSGDEGRDAIALTGRSPSPPQSILFFIGERLSDVGYWSDGMGC